MDRKNQWRIWQLINEVGLRSEGERKLLRDGCEEFPAQIIRQQIENLEKLGFNDAAGMDIKKIMPHPNLNYGISNRISIYNYILRGFFLLSYNRMNGTARLRPP